jgi:hypothetical protein
LRAAPWIAAAIAVVWIAVACGRALSLLSAWQHLRRVRRNATPVVIAGLAGFEAGTRHAALCVSSEVDTPAILGFFRPVLLLPEWLAPKLTEDELRQIALHECEHLRRRDDWLNLLLQLGLVLLPLNPALPWLNRRISVQRELACDAAVVASTARPLAYAASLTHLAEQRLQRNSLRLALAAWGRKSELAQRVHALLRQPSAWTSRQSGMASAAAAAVLLTASAGLAHTPSFVRFADEPVSFAAAQAPATIVTPEATADILQVSAKAQTPAAHMLPATFVMKPKPKAHHQNKTQQPQATLQPVEMFPHQFAAPHFVRTSVDSNEQDNAPMRFVTAEFITPYVAVPVRNGWILIEL